MSTLLLSSTALGVQRTVLTVYTQQLESSFSQYIILAAAIALASYGGSKAIGNYAGGMFSQSKGRRPTEISGIIILIIGSVFLAFADSLGWFFIGNSFVGFGIGTLFAASAISFTDIVKTSDRAKALALMELSVYVGTAIGAFFAGIIGVSKLPFIIALIIAIIALLTSLLIRETTKYAESSEIPLFPTLEEKMNQIHHHRDDLVKTSSKELLQLIHLDREVNRDPELIEIGKVSYIKRFRSPSLIVVFSTGIMSRIADTAIIIIFPLLIIEFGYSTAQLGILTSTFTIFWAAGIAVSGPLSDNIGRKIPLFVGEFMEGLGYIIILYLDLIDLFPIVFLGTAVAGFGRGIYFPVPPSTATELVMPKDKAKTLGFYRLMLDFGYVIGAVLVVILVDFRTNSENLYTPVFTLIIGFLFLLGVSTIIFLKDPKPGFKQLRQVTNHIHQVRNSMSSSFKSIYTILTDLEKSVSYLGRAKQFEQAADLILERMTMQTYSGGIKASDAVEILQLTNKIDKVAGHTMRAVRKLHLLKEPLPPVVHESLVKYSLVLELQMQTSIETITLIPIRIDLAAEHSYEVSFVEEVLDDLHKSLWREIMNMADELQPSSLILLLQAIDSLEKGANELEDAIEIIRILAFKHQVYLL
ncbi:MAG: MFS transporter [Candidatus Heimdallarchaeota archaeon]|nr:MFS transporter [Candidatus Heimdallarchaeota archaeon]